jgi:tRNA pseudouridine65 synthase
LLQRLRDQLGRRVYPVHRLDRATGGVLLFGLSSGAARQLVDAFTAGLARKRYWAIVRGHLAGAGLIDHPLVDLDSGVSREARTRYQALCRAELPIPVGRYQTARYTLLELEPLTGRQHQLRRHLKHASHPIVGDTTYGRGEHNRLFRELTGLQRLWLLARSLAFPQPWTGQNVTVTAPPDEAWLALLERLGWADAPVLAGAVRAGGRG